MAFSYWIDIPWFRTEGKLAAVLIKPSLGVSNWPVIYIINYTPTSSLALFNTTPPTSFLAPLPRKKKTSARGVSHAHPLLCFKLHKDVEEKSLAKLAPSYEVASAYLVHMLEARFASLNPFMQPMFLKLHGIEDP
jgi:hypothetical protein